MALCCDEHKTLVASKVRMSLWHLLALLFAFLAIVAVLLLSGCKATIMPGVPGTVIAKTYEEHTVVTLRGTVIAKVSMRVYLVLIRVDDLTTDDFQVYPCVTTRSDWERLSEGDVHNFTVTVISGEITAIEFLE